MESSHIAAIAMAAIITGGVIITMLLQAWITPKDKRGGGHARVPLDRLDALEQRLTRIEQSIDAMAVEVERISEGQRFATKLLSERGASVPERRP